MMRRILVVQLACLLTTVRLGHCELNLPIQQIESWATNLGYSLYELCQDVTALEDFTTSYMLELESTKVEEMEEVVGMKLVNEMKINIEAMLANKVQAVKSLVKVAENAYAKHVHQDDIKLDYPKAKNLNTSTFHLEENEHFNYIPVNLNQSTVHVPTNVFDESIKVLNGIDWSEELDEHFTKNYEKDPTLTWQYFASSTGFFRNYPGIAWPKTKVDMFDCRTRGWYIQAATSTKDIVILIDASGSMLGLRMEIAKAAVRKIVDTLSDDDFFNIITFSRDWQYLDDCFNGSLVQANADNKKKILDSLKNVNPMDIAEFGGALSEAFNLLKTENETGRCAQCNQAIMLITDGAPETYQSVFQEYNRPNAYVRIFTYMIGQEVGDEKQLTWMACANRGYYSHISTLADVHEHIQTYVRVLSRPMVIMRADHTTWTSVYFDTAHEPQGLSLTTSVGKPVFDISNDTRQKGILVGVMGTDVPIKELIKLTPHYKMGVNGYAFAITNNGYIIFHPDFRPEQNGQVKPNYNSVDLSEVELSDNVDELRRKMVDRVTGNMTMKVRMHYDGMKRVTVQEQNYFFTDIANTPFSLGIALPSGYGMNRLKGQIKLKDADSTSLGTSHVKLAPWNYCKMETNETKQNAMEMLIKYLEYGRQDLDIYSERCDQELIEGLLFDAHVTKDALTNWVKMNENTSKRTGIEMVFIGTKSGLTRYYTLVDDVTDRHFVYEQNGTIEELYYKRSVANGEVFTFSVPFDAGARELWNETVVTASMPIMLARRGRQAVAAVVGLQIQLPHFYDLFMKMTSSVDDSSPTDSHITCNSDQLDCYLLDNNGFVVLSERLEEIGTFFGEIDGHLMKALSINETDRKMGPSKGVFERVMVFDYQAICEIQKKASSGANRLILDPFRWMFHIVTAFTQEIAMFLVQFSMYSWWPGSRTTVFAQSNDVETENSDVLARALDKLSKHYDPELVYKWGNELVSSTDYRDPAFVEEWFRHKVEQTIEGENACLKERGLYTSRLHHLPVSGTLTHCSACNRSYTIHRVFKTNLMLLAIDSKCRCMPYTISIRAEEVTSNQTCQRLQAQVYRKRPIDCFSYYEEEDSGECGSSRARLMQAPSSVLLYTCILFASTLAFKSSTKSLGFIFRH